MPTHFFGYTYNPRGKVHVFKNNYDRSLCGSIGLRDCREKFDDESCNAEDVCTLCSRHCKKRTLVFLPTN
jgi:hypothetical protein